jgi:hypothetical protein
MPDDRFQDVVRLWLRRAVFICVHLWLKRCEARLAGS